MDGIEVKGRLPAVAKDVFSYFQDWLRDWIGAATLDRGVKRTGRDANLSPLSDVEIKNSAIQAPLPPQRDNYPLLSFNLIWLEDGNWI
jgi:hypothetical protein